MSSYRGAGWLAHNSVHANDYTFFQEIDQFKQEEPVEALEPELRGLLASIGIKKGRLHRCVGMLYGARPTRHRIRHRRVARGRAARLRPPAVAGGRGAR